MCDSTCRICGMSTPPDKPTCAAHRYNMSGWDTWWNGWQASSHDWPLCPPEPEPERPAYFHPSPDIGSFDEAGQ